MTKKSIWNNLIVGIMILSLSILPSFSILVGVKKIEAATNASSYDNLGDSYDDYGNIYDDPNGGYYQQNGNQYTLSANNILSSDIDITAQVLGCSNVPSLITKSLANLFDKQKLKKLGDSIGNEALSAATTETVTLDPETKGILGKIADTTDDNKQREECLNGIASYLAKQQLADLTQKTVNWINSGYNGDAFYIKNQESFFGSIREQTLQQLIGPFSDIENLQNYPWGKEFARSMIISTRNRADEAVQNSLKNTIPEETRTAFNNSFTEGGGWDTWLNFTQGAGNNPLSFELNASNYVNSKIDETIENQKEEINQNDGFLSQKRCVEYEPEKTVTIPNNPGDYGEEKTVTTKGACKKYETVTPGQVIKETLNTAIGSPVRQLELADDINSSLSQIFSAMMNDLANRGLSGLDKLYQNQNTNTYAQFGGFGINKIYDSEGNDISGEYYDETGKIISINKGNGWNTGNFDITTDLGDRCIGGILKKGAITTQKDYILAVRASQEKLPDIIPALGDLDYCIPGPNPRWERSTKNVISAMIGYIRDTYIDETGNVIKPNLTDYFNFNSSDKPWEQLNVPDDYIVRKGGSDQSYTGTFTAVGATVGTIIPGVGTAVGAAVGFIVGGTIDAINYFKNNNAAKDLALARNLFEVNKNTQIKNLSEDFANYKNIADIRFGQNSPILTEDYYGYTSSYDHVQNDEYLDMANAGLSLTKDISTYVLNVYDANVEYNDLITETNSNIYKLTQIQKKVREIIKTAEERRRDDYKKRGDLITYSKCFDPNLTNSCASEPSGNNKANTKNTFTLNAEDCKIESFTASNGKSPVYPYNPKSDSAVIMKWKTSNCDSVTFIGNQVTSNQPTSGSETVTPSETTKYTLSAENTKNKTSKSVLVYVTETIGGPEENNSNFGGGSNFSPDTCKITKFTSDKTEVLENKPVVISWTTNKCTTISIDGVGANQNTSGSATVSPSHSTIYKINASNNTTSDSDSLTITVKGTSGTPQ